MTDKQLDILINIIGGVESGGQIYGKRRYDAYAAPYANSPDEHTITLGWCQFYGYNARALCQRIFDTDKTTFRKCDTANIEKRLSQDWVARRWNPTSVEKSALLKIISSDVGKKVQDEMFKEDMKIFIKDAEIFGITDIGSQMMYCEIRHLGGKVPTERIFKRATKPYTVNTVFASLILDQKDTSNNLQVGDKQYQSRHEKCVEWIQKYVESSASTDIKEGENNMSYDKYINSTGTHYISNSGSDENGRYTNGKAGDQTGNEWCLRSWYNRPWNCVLRHPDEKVRMKIAELACAAALNNNIGYDQNERYTFWNQLVKVNYDPSKIAVKCESDCSAGVIAITKAVGYLLGMSKLKNLSATYTGNMKSGFKAAGFTVLTESKYTTGTSYLLPGDILLNEASHTATNITKGNKATSSSTPTTPTTSTSSSLNESVKWKGTTTSKLNVRTWAGSSNPTCSFSPLAKGAEIGVCDTVKASDGSDWYFIEYNGKKGFVSAKYVKKSGDTTASSTTSNTKYSKTQFVKDVQKAIGAKVDGDAGTETFSKVPMLSTTTNRNHSVVKYLQKYLNVLGYNVGKEDCDYGDATKSGVIKFQKSKGLGADGIVGQNTWKASLK